ncbi:hypothetical protein EV643_106346 [Kribbella sp. VKM Ac-2527]|uniref:Uncharacterized protein n=1 Tax=Kribbella caucasensis TaxID=2512215 RepID=A0A4R6KGI8_9ACTN|nr:hypothetical protein [Kribbella sp. VKM Ac-2527]TDO49376.1 hypothetical protein EV643_106346 [Kribbella sp. VKM Ac-2527]
MSDPHRTEEPDAEPGGQRHLIKRRGLLAGTLAVTGAAALPGTPAYAAEVTLSADGVTLIGQTDGTLSIRDRDGIDRIEITHFLFDDQVLGEHRTYGGTPVLVTLTGGQQAIQLDYLMDSSSGSVTVRGIFTVELRKAHLRWEVRGSNSLKPSSFKVGRTVLSGTEAFEPLVKWNRDSGGGIPFETNDGVIYTETYPDYRAFFRLAASAPADTDTTWLSAPGTTQPDGSAVTEFDVVLGLMQPHSAGVVATGTTLGVDVWTDQPFNLWKTAGQTMTLHAQVVNGSTTSKFVTVTWSAWDYDGVPVTETRTATIAARTVWNGDYQLTAPKQGIFFTEVAATTAGATAFARTNLSVLPSFTYQDTEPMFGLANYPWLLKPTKQAVKDLLLLLGMRWIRIAHYALGTIPAAPGIPPNELDALGIKHNVQRGGVPIGGTTAAKEKWAGDVVSLSMAGGAQYYEAGNELNDPLAPVQNAAAYVNDGLIPLRGAMQSAGATFKVMNAATAGLDYVWLEQLEAAGGWDRIDVLAYHPGRAYFTADYAPPASTWPDSSLYWNFLGSLQEARNLMSRYGGNKELWLTEVYAQTRPNTLWTDTYRHAAENVLLQLALAKAYGVDGLTWYTLNDSTIHHPQEANPTDREYHFGLLNRDLSAKPSMLAFATIVRALDRATWDRELTFSDPEVKGLLFNSPSGRLAILWTRKDGYLLNQDGTPGDTYFAMPDPWVDDWPTKTTAVLAATGATVRELDCIGQEVVRTVAGGKVTVTLDGAPRIFYGLTDTVDQTATFS